MHFPIDMMGWSQYWEVFDKLCDSLLQRGRNKLVQQLDEARLYVKNTYDATITFLKRIRSLFTREQDRFTHEEKKWANTLVNSLQMALENI